MLSLTFLHLQYLHPQIVENNFDLRPGAIIKQFNLQEITKARGGRFYRDTAAYGHFGRQDLDLPWENVNEKAEKLKQASINMQRN